MAVEILFLSPKVETYADIELTDTAGTKNETLILNLVA